MNSGDLQFKRFSIGAAIIAMAAGSCVIIGWSFDISLFKRLVSGMTAMVPLTAVGFFIAGASLFLLCTEEGESWRRRLGACVAGVVGIIGALVLIEYLFVVDLGIDLILFPSAVLDEGTLWPGRPSIITSLGFLFSSSALLALNFRNGWLSLLFASATFFISFIAIVGYAYNVDSLYQIVPSVPIALHTAATLMVLSLGILSARPDSPVIRIVMSDRAGGIMARRLLVASLLLPFVLYLLDFAGQRLGLVPKELDIAVFAVANVAVFVGLILWTTGLLNRMDSRREAADEWLRESEAALKRAQLIGNVGSWEWNIEIGELRLSDQTYRQLGLEKGLITPTYEMFGQSIHPDDRGAFTENVERALAGMAPFNMEMRIVQQGGSVRVVDTRGEVERDPAGRPYRMVGVSLDITDRKRAEITSKKNEERLQAIFESSRSGIFLLDKDGLITFANRSMEYLFGYSMEDLIGSSYIEHIHPDQRSAGGRIMTRLIADEIESGVIERHFIRSDGSDFWGIVSGRRMTDQSKDTVYLIGIVTDITKRKQAEEEILRLNESLEMRIAERTKQLEAANNELRSEIEERKRAEKSINQLLREKELLLKEVHHRIKNNLTAISGLLMLQIKSSNNREAIAAIQDANNRVYSMALLYDKLYRADTFKDTSIKEYLIKLVDEIIGLFQNRNIVSLDLNIDDFIVDAKILFPLGIIINELITNAMKYAFSDSSGGVLQISVLKKDRHVLLVVQDNGNGMPEEIDIKKPEGFGLKLIGILSNQLGGRFLIERRNGTKCTLEFDI
jgi:PAS domain S-box-containing protein